MYSFESNTSKSTIHVLTMGCFIAAFLLFGFSNTAGLSFPVLYQLTGIGLLVVGIYFLTRYALKKYRFEIVESNITNAAGEPILDLVITEIKGTRHVVVARVALREIATVEVIDTKKDKAAAKEKRRLIIHKNEQGNEKYVVFKYMNTPFVSYACYIQVPDENSVLVIPVDRQMLQILQWHRQNNTLK